MKHWSKMGGNTFDTFDKILTDIQLFLHSLYPFLKPGVMFPCFKTDENLDFLADSIKLECRTSANISVFSRGNASILACLRCV